MTAAAREPMLARMATEVPQGDDWVFEPKYDGIRVLALVSRGTVALVSRNGNDKTGQFPEIARAVLALAARAGRELVLDGEIVASSAGTNGDRALARFQALQGRVHARDAIAVARQAEESPVTLIVFDLLVDGGDVVIDEPWLARRDRLERLITPPGDRPDDSRVRLSEVYREVSGTELLAQARRAGWEGIMAKQPWAPYEPGVRSRAWLKLKAEHRQEFVVGGYTEPRNSREHLGALLLGYYQDGRLVYAGHAGGGFTRASLRHMAERLTPLERATSPFTTTPRTNERAHWVEPRVVVEVRFNEWTGDGRLRQPVYVGVREDKDARDVVREPSTIADALRTSGTASRERPARGGHASPVSARGRRSRARKPGGA